MLNEIIFSILGMMLLNVMKVSIMQISEMVE